MSVPSRDLWDATGVYLNTASYGLPPKPGWEALQAALEDWRGGRTSWEHWGDATERSRAIWAELVGVTPDDVAVGATVSGLVGLVAASVPDGARVLSPDIEFTSNQWPFSAQGRGIEVETVPAAKLAEAIDARTDVVAFSAAHSATGEVTDLDAIADAAAHHGAMTVLDATQACGWLPLDASRFDIVTCAAYKWLMSPRGTVFMSVARERRDAIVPHAAGWFAGEDVHSSYHGPPLRLAANARRFDTSPAWFSWAGTEPALKVVLDTGVDTIHAHNLRLANAFRRGLGLEPSNSAIVCADVDDAEARLRAAGVMAATREGQLRTSWHLYNNEEDVARALDALIP